MDVLDFLYPNGEKKAQLPPPVDTKTDVSGYYKTSSGAIVSKDEESLRAYKIRKAKSLQLNTMRKEVDQIKNDISEIKEMLKGLVR